MDNVFFFMFVFTLVTMIGSVFWMVLDEKHIDLAYLAFEVSILLFCIWAVVSVTIIVFS